MSFANIFYLRFMKGLSTVELESRYPDEKRKIAIVALCSLPDQTLRSVANSRIRGRVQRIRERCLRRWGHISG
jgi:hypothetical protein